MWNLKLSKTKLSKHCAKYEKSHQYNGVEKRIFFSNTLISTFKEKERIVDINDIIKPYLFIDCTY